MAKTPPKEKPEGYVFGRPVDYIPEYCQGLIDHMSQGYSYETFAANINSTRMTLYNWEKMYPDFLYAKKIGIERCQKFWEEMGLKGNRTLITYNDEGKKVTESKLQAAIWIFNMKARFKWFDVPEKDILQIPEGADKRKILEHAKEAIKLLEEDILNEESQLQTIEVKSSHEEKIQDGKTSEKL